MSYSLQYLCSRYLTSIYWMNEWTKINKCGGEGHFRKGEHLWYGKNTRGRNECTGGSGFSQLSILAGIVLGYGVLWLLWLYNKPSSNLMPMQMVSPVISSSITPVCELLKYYWLLPQRLQYTGKSALWWVGYLRSGCGYTASLVTNGIRTQCLLCKVRLVVFQNLEAAPDDSLWNLPAL